MNDKWDEAQYEVLLPDGASFKDADEFYSRAFPLPPTPKVTTAEEYAAMPIEEQLQVLKEELLFWYDQHDCCGNTEIEEWLDSERTEQAKKVQQERIEENRTIINRLADG